MKNYSLFLFLVFSILLAGSCKSDTKQNLSDDSSKATERGQAGTSLPTTDDQAVQSTGNFADDTQYAVSLLALAVGKWQNAASPEKTMVLTDTKIQYFTDGKLTRENTIEIDPRCRKAECQGGIGWCIIELSGENPDCNVVARIDSKNLIIHPAGDKATQIAYTKVLE